MSVDCALFENTDNVTSTFLQLANGMCNTSMDDELLKIGSCSQLCPQMCLKLYGNGNPDIAGIGVMLSLAIQAVFVFALGPCLSVISGLLLFVVEENGSLLIWLLHELLLEVAKAALLTWVPMILSSIVTICHGPTVFEVLMVYKLNYLEQVIMRQIFNAELVNDYFKLSLEWEDNPDGEKIRHPFRRYSSVLAFFFSLGFDKMMKRKFDYLSGSHNDLNSEMVQLCYTYADFPRLNNTQVVPIVPELSMILVSSVVVTVLPTLLRLIKIRNIRVKHASGLLIAVFMIVETAVLSYDLMSQIASLRSHMLRKAGTSDIDNYWGFGQVAAIISIAPILAHTLKTMVFCFVSPRNFPEFNEWYGLRQILLASETGKEKVP